VWAAGWKAGDGVGLSLILAGGAGRRETRKRDCTLASLSSLSSFLRSRVGTPTSKRGRKLLIGNRAS
jgi:hypothetical protein